MTQNPNPVPLGYAPGDRVLVKQDAARSPGPRTAVILDPTPYPERDIAKVRYDDTQTRAFIAGKRIIGLAS